MRAEQDPREKAGANQTNGFCPICLAPSKRSLGGKDGQLWNCDRVYQHHWTLYALKKSELLNMKSTKEYKEIRLQDILKSDKFKKKRASKKKGAALSNFFK